MRNQFVHGKHTSMHLSPFFCGSTCIFHFSLRKRFSYRTKILLLFEYECWEITIHGLIVCFLHPFYFMVKEKSGDVHEVCFPIYMMLKFGRV